MRLGCNKRKLRVQHSTSCGLYYDGLTVAVAISPRSRLQRCAVRGRDESQSPLEHEEHAAGNKFYLLKGLYAVNDARCRLQPFREVRIFDMDVGYHLGRTKLLNFSMLVYVHI